MLRPLRVGRLLQYRADVSKSATFFLKDKRKATDPDDDGDEH
jgi:hypothetical protein